jgi:hypothetical protein
MFEVAAAAAGCTQHKLRLTCCTCGIAGLVMLTPTDALLISRSSKFVSASEEHEHPQGGRSAAHHAPVAGRGTWIRLLFLLMPLFVSSCATAGGCSCVCRCTEWRASLGPLLQTRVGRRVEVGLRWVGGLCGMLFLELVAEWDGRMAGRVNHRTGWWERWWVM